MLSVRFYTVPLDDDEQLARILYARQDFALVRTLEAGFVPSLAVDPHEFIAAVRIDRQMHELVDHGPDGITGFGLAERPCLPGIKPML